MPNYYLGTTSRSRLAGVHPDLAAVVQRAIRLTAQDFSVHEGPRSIATQREYVRRGVSQTMNSRHLVGANGYAHAVDLVPWSGGMLRWEWPLIWPIADAMRRAAAELGVPVRWGGCWQPLSDFTSEASLKRGVDAYVALRRSQKRKAFLDGPHYELPRLPRYL